MPREARAAGGQEEGEEIKGQERVGVRKGVMTTKKKQRKRKE
ncbi:hypothetical protein E2C01_099030 [Portunus trituberculatus]|uniref:Uncharacterized protein n=1 Tax=Portunus trituberculatus TaxID=210409 RepID=A0A5B7K4F0_PORTR|nr:hypothetical protein [Portunus trituberculatus]